ncbi:hypothetical protein DY102_07195 [Apilactobacillus timberlakei]|uniref:hypothetical protein n=1 Tax=Apilactobacillus timberlakei TaxID=2008380 RepID=UPI0011266DB4|nr:hypothetical protein [Apilactobacillus timberlakei]TPR21469.1 hypothetical protein DY102_07195 [Apilactobacillus timberlakei]
MSVDLISTLTASVLSGSVIATFISGKFNDKNAIHNESVWREQLFDLSKKDCLTREDIELFRTCVSALRGIPYRGTYYAYDPYFKRNIDSNIDDLCIVYYYYLVDLFDINKYYYNNALFYRKNRELIYFNDLNNDIVVFRQLCRLLVKTDWNKRTIDSIFNCEKHNDTYKKCSLILWRHIRTSVPYNNYIRKCYGKRFNINNSNDYTSQDNEYKISKNLLINFLYFTSSLYVFLLVSYILYCSINGINYFSYSNLTNISCLFKSLFFLFTNHDNSIISTIILIVLGIFIIIIYRKIRSMMFPSK